MGFLILIGVKHDEGLYHQPIMKITQVKIINHSRTEDEFHNVDHQFDQRLTGYIQNGKFKRRKLTVNNSYSDSNAMDHKYKVGQEAFLVTHGTNLVHSTIKDQKRDVPIAFLTILAISLLLVFLKLSGLTAILSITINSILFYLALLWNQHSGGSQVLALFSGLAIVFSLVTLLLILGINRKMLIIFLATMLGTALSIGLSLIVFSFTHEKGIYYESMQYVTQLPKPLFLAESLIGSLGAIMDESTDMVSSLFTLKQEKPDISRKQIFLSGREIGKSIMGPLINVLFFIFISDTLPMALLFLKNGNSWGYSFSMNMSLGMTQSLISGIGITLSILLTSGLASWLIKGGEHS